MYNNIPEDNFGEILKIICCRYEENISPWDLQNIFTPFWRLYCNFSSGAAIKLPSGKEIAMKPGYFYLVPGYMLFSTSSDKPFDQFYIHFTLKSCSTDRRDIICLNAEKYHIETIRNFRCIKQNLENRQLLYLSAMAILSSVLLKIDPNILIIPKEYDPRIRKVIDWMQKNPEKNNSNDFFANMINMSRNSFIRLFENNTGEAPQTYSRRKRIEKACELLHFSNLSVDDIAIATGFADRYHFSRIFKKLMRYSPAKFRKQLQSR